MRRLLLITSAVALFTAPAFAQGDYDEKPAGAGDAELNAPLDTTDSVDANADFDATLDADETQLDVDGDGDLETLKNGYTDQHAWIDAQVFADGELIGEVERVHYTGEDIDTIVIEMEGIAEVGGREVEIALGDAEMSTDADGAASFNLALTKAEVDALPDFDEALASDYPLSDVPGEDADELLDETPGEGTR